MRPHRSSIGFPWRTDCRAACRSGDVTAELQRWCGYGSIPIDTFLVGWTSIYQLFWGSLGTRVLTHPHVLELSCVTLLDCNSSLLVDDCWFYPLVIQDFPQKHFRTNGRTVFFHGLTVNRASLLSELDVQLSGDSELQNVRSKTIINRPPMTGNDWNPTYKNDKNGGW